VTGNWHTNSQQEQIGKGNSKYNKISNPTNSSDYRCKRWRKNPIITLFPHGHDQKATSVFRRTFCLLPYCRRR